MADDYRYVRGRMKAEHAAWAEGVAASSGIRDSHFFGLALIIGTTALEVLLGRDDPSEAVVVLADVLQLVAGSVSRPK